VSFVIYDVETTGLTKGFDQIVQFAAVLTDAQLNVTDQIQLRCRLLPHVVPAPEALHVTGMSIEALTDPSLPSHYEMICQVRSKLESWCPALFLGFNSLPFDEEFLRQAFYQCLFDPYLTNSQSSARADVLNLCRVAADLKPEVLRPAIDAEGRPVFRLRQLAEANGIEVGAAHEAMPDVMTTLALCQHVFKLAPDVWSQFLKFSQKATVESFINDEEAFLFSETIGNRHRPRIVTRIGGNPDQAGRHYCFDLGADVEALRNLTDEGLTELCRSKDRPIVTIRSNAAPTLWALYEATPEHLAPFDEGEILKRVADIKDDKSFLERLRRAAYAAEPSYPPSSHVEEQIYQGGFTQFADRNLMQQFHSAPWPQRLELAEQFADGRHKRLAKRLIYFEQADLLSENQRTAMAREINRRLADSVVSDARWRSVPKAIAEFEALQHLEMSADQKILLAAYQAYLADQRLLLGIGAIIEA
jgi:exodeoxyribonuclease-1